ncbi:MAG: hypothetical protein E6552_11620, partial [Sutterella wadsworthensis]|nr:hypothetical protein [Sutterella wadsworthensis]
NLPYGERSGDKQSRSASRGHEAAFLKAARDFSSHAERSARVRRMAPFGRRAASGGAFLYAAHFGGA